MSGRSNRRTQSKALTSKAPQSRGAFSFADGRPQRLVHEEIKVRPKLSSPTSLGRPEMGTPVLRWGGVGGGGRKVGALRLIKTARGKDSAFPLPSGRGAGVRVWHSTSRATSPPLQRVPFNALSGTGLPSPQPSPTREREKCHAGIIAHPATPTSIHRLICDVRVPRAAAASHPATSLLHRMPREAGSRLQWRDPC